MASNGTLSVAALDADLAALNERAGLCRELIHRSLMELIALDDRADDLLASRYALTRITAATTATMQPRCG